MYKHEKLLKRVAFRVYTRFNDRLARLQLMTAIGEKCNSLCEQKNSLESVLLQ